MERAQTWRPHPNHIIYLDIQNQWLLLRSQSQVSSWLKLLDKKLDCG